MSDPWCPQQRIEQFRQQACRFSSDSNDPLLSVLSKALDLLAVAAKPEYDSVRLQRLLTSLKNEEDLSSQYETSDDPTRLLTYNVLESMQIAISQMANRISRQTRPATPPPPSSSVGEPPEDYQFDLKEEDVDAVEDDPAQPQQDDVNVQEVKEEAQPAGEDHNEAQDAGIPAQLPVDDADDATATPTMVDDDVNKSASEASTLPQSSDAIVETRAILAPPPFIFDRSAVAALLAPINPRPRRPTASKTSNRSTPRAPPLDDINSAVTSAPATSAAAVAAVNDADKEVQDAAITDTAAPALDLIPDARLVADGAQDFQAHFQSRYCPNDRIHLMPPFYVGSLQSAIREAFDCPGRPVSERRPLALYIHNDESAAADGFATTVLCNESILDLLRSQFVLWPWDVTSDQNEDKLMADLRECSLLDVREVVEYSLDHVNRFPLLILLTRERGQIGMIDHVDGDAYPEQAMDKMLDCIAAFSSSEDPFAAPLDTSNYDNEAVIRSMSPSLREAVLADADDSVLESLPPAMQEEAKRLRSERDSQPQIIEIDEVEHAVANEAGPSGSNTPRGRAPKRSRIADETNEEERDDPNDENYQVSPRSNRGRKRKVE